MAEVKVGVITHYFAKPGVAVIKITSGELAKGDKIHIKGHTSDFTQVVGSLEIEHQPVSSLKVGQEAGLKVEQRVHEHDEVFRVEG